jgi:hypothetical protein
MAKISCVSKQENLPSWRIIQANNDSLKSLAFPVRDFLPQGGWKMIQYNYKLNWTAGDQGFESKLNKILQALCMRPASKQANAIFIQLSFHNMGMEMAEKIREKIREFLPRAVVVGMTEMLFNQMARPVM